MRMYIVKSPDRNIDTLLKAIEVSGNVPVIQGAIWAKGLDPKELERLLHEEYDLSYSKLQIGWRNIEDAEWACALSHHKVYLKANDEINESDNWVCVMEDDVELLPDFFSRIDDLKELSFEDPTVIQLFTRGKRFCSLDISLSKRHKSLYKADFPPGQTALYLINRKALQLATESFVAKGDSDWPIWGRKCDFLLSYPWVGIEYPIGTTLPVYSRTRAQYYGWQIKALLGLDFFKWKRKSLSYSDYFFYMIKPLIFRIMLKMRIYRPQLNNDPNSIWLRR